MIRKTSLIALFCAALALALAPASRADDLSYIPLGSGDDPDGQTVTANFAGGVNDDGDVVLDAASGADITPYVWANGTFYPLPTLDTYPRTEATQINDKNEVIGWGEFASLTGFRGIFWSYGEGSGWDVHDLGSLEESCGSGASGPCDTSFATGLNASGQVVGYSDKYECVTNTQCNDVPEPFASDAGGPLQAIYTNPNGLGAVAVDDSGDVALNSSSNPNTTTLEPSGAAIPFDVQALSPDGKYAVGVDTNTNEAEVWLAADDATAPLVPLSGDEYSSVAAINNDGEAVGSSTPASGEEGARAVTWFVSNEGTSDPVDLNTLVPSGTPTLYFASGISNSGYVSGGGEHEGLSDPGPPWLLGSDLQILSTDDLPDGTVGAHYSYAFSSDHGTPPYEWTISDGDLPPGLTLNASTGAVTGTPSKAGTFDFQVTLQDSGQPAGESTRSFALTVLEPSQGASAEDAGTFNGNSVTITERCPAGTSGGCAGSVEVEAPGGGSHAHLVASKRSKLVVVAKGKFSIKAGHTKKLVLRLTKKGRAVLKGKRKITVTVLTTTRIAGKKDTRRAKVKLRRKRRR